MDELHFSSSSLDLPTPPFIPLIDRQRVPERTPSPTQSKYLDEDNCSNSPENYNKESPTIKRTLIKPKLQKKLVHFSSSSSDLLTPPYVPLANTRSVKCLCKLFDFSLRNSFKNDNMFLSLLHSLILKRI